MTPLEINIAICEATHVECYWQQIRKPDSEPGQMQYTGPDFYHDLNEIQGVIKSNSIDGTKIGRMLAKIVLGYDGGDEDITLNYWALLRVAKATPAQWCEAYLRALGKWPK